MERQTLKAQVRDTVGTGAARALRRAESIPAVVYRGGKSIPLTLDRKDMIKFIKKTSGEQAIVNLNIDGSDSKLVLMKEYQTDPVKNKLLHVDFLEVSLSEKITVTVPVTLVGEAIGVKRDKGILQQVMMDVDIESLPDNIPGHLELDVTELETGQSLHVSDLVPSEGVLILSGESEVLASVIAPIVEEEAPAEEEEEEAEAPELVKKGKKEEEEEGAAEEEKKGEE
jgi:large subunit ribosomal protein L25